jgi:hypothetical protein
MPVLDEAGAALLDEGGTAILEENELPSAAGATSRVAAIIDYLVAKFQAAGALSAVSVYDGPFTPEEDAELILWVGVDDPAAAQQAGGPVTAADSRQAKAGLAQKRDETVTVYCAAGAWSGDDMSTARAAAYSIVAAVEDLIRGDTASPAGAYIQPGVTVASLQQEATTTAARARVVFQIVYSPLIGT